MIKAGLKNLTLVVGAIVFSLASFELGLTVFGAYSELVGQDLRPSPAIWERPRNATERHRHPDLGVPIDIVFDDDGVRNHVAPTTREKTGIVGFFGDSFTENRRVPARFTITRLLDGLASGGHRFVNFGVDAYGLDQSWLRYRKYRHLNMKAVIYVLCENDFRNLYETNLVRRDGAGGIQVRVPEANRVLRWLGKLRTPYVAIAAFHQVKAIMAATPGAWDFSDRLSRVADRFSPDRKAQKVRLHDTYADSLFKDLTGPSPRKETLELAKTFRAVLKQWRDEVEADGRRFFVVVLPRPEDRAVGARLVGEDPRHVVHLADFMTDYRPLRFKNDDHWNERGNLQAAKVLRAHPWFADYFPTTDPTPFFEARGRMISDFYQRN